jgi:hypothetical protein
MQTRQFVAIVCSVVLIGVQPQAQASRANDPRIKTELITATQTRKAGQPELARGTLLEKPEDALTKKEYEKEARFARLFAAGGVFDVTVRAYAQSNTVRFQVASSTN